MIEDIITEIEAKVRRAEAVEDSKKKELLDLLEKLKTEVTSFSQTHGEQANSIAGFAQISTQEATRKEPDSKLVEISVKGLRSSVAGFEKSHPRLAQVVNSISNSLSNLGI
jgi:Mg2+ and Co2+ transporter CorA